MNDSWVSNSIFKDKFITYNVLKIIQFSKIHKNKKKYNERNKENAFQSQRND